MDRDAYILTSALLDGERDAHVILADRLEEQGDIGLAQWARARKRNASAKLNFALGILPHRQALALACDFAEHVIDKRTTLWWAPNMSEGIEPLRLWLAGAASDDDVIAACLILDHDPRYGGDPYNRTPAQRQVCASLAGAAQNARLAARHFAAHSSKAHHYDGECAADTRKTARFARASRTNRLLGAFRSSRQSELQWQIGRTRDALAMLIDGGICERN